MIIGVGGVVGGGFITTEDAAEVHPALLVTVKALVPGVSPDKVVVVPFPDIFPGLIIQVPNAGKPYSTTLPVPTVHVGWVIVPTVGAVGTAGAALMTTLVVGGEVHPPAMVTVKV